MANELTYILGAGASFQSIPVVKTFSSRFDQFTQQVLSLLSDDFIRNNDKVDECKTLHEIATKLNNEFRSHQSFDTYFKKLFHTKQSKELNKAKKALNLFFIWEHLAKVMNESDLPPKADSFFYKQAKVDKRYDALIAGLLRPENGISKTYCKTNFITWNYDLNLLSSIKNYFYPNDNHRDFLKKIKRQSESEWNIEDQISIINMNGYFYSKFFDEAITLDELEFRRVFVQKIAKGYFEDSFVDNDARLVKFAWEGVNFESKIAMLKIEMSDNVVIIGYTFPLYNRFIDLDYLPQTFVTRKKIYIQDPNAENLKQNFQDYYQLGNRSNIITISNCDSFYVPSDIFGIKPPPRSYVFSG